MSDTPDTITIDGFGPLPVARPASVAELCDLVRRCAAEGKAVYPVGGGTMLDHGLPPTKPGLAIDTRALDQVIDYPARDMTITVQAGITVARLREVTRAEGLDLPIDVPDPDRATLGGAIACNVSGPRRCGYGTFRDYVLGITTVNDRGEAVSAGGRVVKNVAGYDLMKLHTGALGTLGVIAQLTLKLRPMPEERGTVTVGLTSERLPGALDLLHQTLSRPTWYMTNNVPEPGDDWERRPPESRWHWPTTIGIEGNHEAIAWQVERLQQELAATNPKYLGGGVGPDHYHSLTDMPLANRRFVVCRFRTSLRPSGVADFCTTAGSLSTQTILIAFPGSGVVLVELLKAKEWQLHKVQDVLGKLQYKAAAYDGNVIIERCPTEWKKSLPVWGRPPADLALQKAVKRALDPNNLFNPGRFVTDT
jgi:glycolate oxidase FAD binding subunit